MDKVIATSLQAHVFRHSQHSKQWVCVAKSKKTCKVRFIRRRDTYLFKVTPEDGETKVSRGSGSWFVRPPRAACMFGLVISAN